MTEESAVVASARRKLEALERDSSDHVAALEHRWRRAQADAKEAADALTKRFEKLATAVRERSAEAAAGLARRKKQETFEFGGEEGAPVSQADAEWEAEVSSLAQGFAPAQRPEVVAAAEPGVDEPPAAAAVPPRLHPQPRRAGRPRHRADDDDDDFSGETWMR